MQIQQAVEEPSPVESSAAVSAEVPHSLSLPTQEEELDVKQIVAWKGLCIGCRRRQQQVRITDL